VRSFVHPYWKNGIFSLDEQKNLVRVLTTEKEERETAFCKSRAPKALKESLISHEDS